MGKESDVDVHALLGFPWAWVDRHPCAQVKPQRLTMPAFLGQPSPFLSSFPTSVVFRTGLWEFFNRGPALPSSVSVCHGRPFFSKDTCALTPMPPSSVTSQVGFSAMPRSFPNFRNIDKTMATSLVDSINLRKVTFQPLNSVLTYANMPLHVKQFPII